MNIRTFAYIICISATSNRILPFPSFFLLLQKNFNNVRYSIFSYPHKLIVFSFTRTLYIAYFQAQLIPFVLKYFHYTETHLKNYEMYQCNYTHRKSNKYRNYSDVFKIPKADLSWEKVICSKNINIIIRHMYIPLILTPCGELSLPEWYFIIIKTRIKNRTLRKRFDLRRATISSLTIILPFCLSWFSYTKSLWRLCQWCRGFPKPTSRDVGQVIVVYCPGL